MRIVGGALRGRRFAGPPGSATRPTSERAREGIASALEARGAIEDRVVLDLFAGTGALAFEALSRGARSAILLDRDRAVVRAIAKAAAELGLGERARAIGMDLCRDASTVAAEISVRAGAAAFDLVFADPPWDRVDVVPPLVDALTAQGAIAEGALVVLEHAARQPPAIGTGWLAHIATYRYGDTAVLLGATRT